MNPSRSAAKQVERPLEQTLDALPALGSHPYTSLYSQARAIRHSRLIVRAETPSTSAISSSDMPAKNRLTHYLALPVIHGLEPRERLFEHEQIR